MIRSQIINGYIKVTYRHEEEMIIVRDIKTDDEIKFHETVIPIIVKTLKSNKKGGN